MFTDTNRLSCELRNFYIIYIYILPEILEKSVAFCYNAIVRFTVPKYWIQEVFADEFR